MLKTGFVTRPISDNATITINDVTTLRVVLDETNTERVLINGVPVLNRIEEILTPDGTFCKELQLDIKFESGLIPTTNPVKQIYLQYRKIIKCHD
ncbi:hypothetical protein [Flavobacterium sp.]|uniref:hypothetical protein n=1 Tax=Flavobacterium sp. TaxID=239 RepID=UPI003753A6F6